jgi:3-phosphoshikimate 1-carboxyvinyltransferase
MSSTGNAMRAMGANIRKEGEEWIVQGTGNGCLLEPEHVLDFGNSGTGVRLAMGLAGSYDMETRFTGDASLLKRPMGRVLEPLAPDGRAGRGGGRRPPAADAAWPAHRQSDHLPRAGGLGAGEVRGPACRPQRAGHHHGDRAGDDPRSHGKYAARLRRGTRHRDRAHGARHIGVVGQGALSGQDDRVPGDPSSAAFPLVAALIAHGSDITIENVLMNPARTGLIETLLEMGAVIDIVNERLSGGEDVADLRVRSSDLKGVTVPADRAPSMIDEYPVLAVAASFAEGETVMQGIEELRVKESDRLDAVARALEVNGVDCTEGRDWLSVRGHPGGKGLGAMTHEAVVETHLDHRMAMSFLVFGLAAEHGARVDDASMIATSFPQFMEVMTGLGAEMEVCRMSFTIAIDGPAASGKGTLARRLAAHYGFAISTPG